VSSRPVRPAPMMAMLGGGEGMLGSMERERAVRLKMRNKEMETSTYLLMEASTVRGFPLKRRLEEKVNSLRSSSQHNTKFL
jgi:hypothetical protein